MTASIVSVSSAEHFLVLTKDDTGESMVLRDLTGDALESMGILAAGGAIANELQAASTAMFHADGLLDQTNTIYESSLQSSSSTTLGSTGTIEFRRDSDDSLIGSVSYSASDTLDDLAADISAISGLTGTVVTDGASVRLEISSTEAMVRSMLAFSSTIQSLPPRAIR